jgi:predicted DNA-binding transcriptional regulator AlpA
MTDMLEGGILSPKDTYKLTSLSGATIWRLRRQGQFPEPIRLSPGRMGWRRTDIEHWLSEREAVPIDCARHRIRVRPPPRSCDTRSSTLDSVAIDDAARARETSTDREGHQRATRITRVCETCLPNWRSPRPHG